MFFVEFSEPSQISISQSEEFLGKSVVISGQISSIKSTPKVTFIDLSDNTGQITCVSFQKINTLSGGEYVEISGTIATYDGRLELIIDEIKCIS